MMSEAALMLILYPVTQHCFAMKNKNFKVWWLKKIQSKFEWQNQEKH